MNADETFFPWDILKVTAQREGYQRHSNGLRETTALTPEQQKFFKELFLRIFRETGEDVVLTGVLDSFGRPEAERWVVVRDDLLARGKIAG